jgi:archaellin
MGQQMPIDVAVTDTQHRHDVTFTDSVFVDGKMRYTQISKVPKAATLKDGVWTYQEGVQHVGSKKEFSITILPPNGAKLLSAEPTPDSEVNENGQTHLRFHGTASDNKRFTFTIRYELPSTSEQEK